MISPVGDEHGWRLGRIVDPVRPRGGGRTPSRRLAPRPERLSTRAKTTVARSGRYVHWDRSRTRGSHSARLAHRSARIGVLASSLLAIRSKRKSPPSSSRLSQLSRLSGLKVHASETPASPREAAVGIQTPPCLPLGREPNVSKRRTRSKQKCDPYTTPLPDWNDSDHLGDIGVRPLRDA